MPCYFVLACALPMLAKSGHPAWSVVVAGAPRWLSMWAQTGSLRSPGAHHVPLPCSETPAEPVSLTRAAFPVLPPGPDTAKASA